MRAVWMVGALVACGAPDPELLFAPGEADVGYQRVEITYDSPGRDEARTLPVEVWYPATLHGEAPVNYAVAGIVSLPSDVAREGASPALDGAAPLIVYSHGSGGQGLLAYPYAEHLASHGWVVMAPDHVGNTASDAVSGTFHPRNRNAIDRPLDIRAVLDAADGIVEGVQVDADNTLLFGHSFGAYTTLAIGGMRLDVDALVASCDGVGEEDDRFADCEVIRDPELQALARDGFRDDRVTALVPQAPAFISASVADSITAIDAPVLLQSGERDQTTPHETQAVPTWEALDGEQDVWMNLPDGGHHTFITICDDLDPALVSLFVSGADEDGCGDTFTPVSEAIPALRASLQAWGDWHVKGVDGWEGRVVQTDWGGETEVSGK